MTNEKNLEIEAKVRAIKAMGTKPGFDRPGEVLGAVKTAFSGLEADPRLRLMNIATYGSEGVGADGGFAAGADFKEVWGPCFGNGSLLGALKPLMTDRGLVIIPVDEAAEWTTTGLTAAQVAEGGTITESKPSMKQVTVQVHKVASLLYASEELAEDVPAFRDYGWIRLGGKVAGNVENLLLNGHGVGQPLGILKGPAVVVQAKTGSQVAATITAANVGGMVSRLLPGGFRDSFWVCSTTALAQVAQLGAGVYNPDSDRGPFGAILGRPLLVSEFLPVLGQQGDIVLVDPRCYVYCAHAPRHQTSVEFAWNQGLEAFRAVVRVGGTPLLSAVVQPVTGGNTMGSAVVLAVRS